MKIPLPAATRRPFLNGAARMFTRLGGQRERGRNVFEKLSATHPETKERIARLEAEIKKLPSGGTAGRETCQQMKERPPG